MRLTADLKSRIRDLSSESPESIALMARRHPDLPMAFIAQQVKARQRIRKKLPSWFANEDIEFPDTLPLEQCSSELAAHYRASLLSGELLADLTGGFGVDAAGFARTFSKVYHVEQDESLSNLVTRNIEALDLGEKFEVIHADGIRWLDSQENGFDALYLDPARRDHRGLKVSSLEACEPDLSRIWGNLLSKAKVVAVKLSPGLDIDATLKELPGICEVHILSIGNECKECCYLARRDWKGGARIVCANHCREFEWNCFEFSREEEKSCEGSYGGFQRYLYEANPSIMKGGGFKVLGDRIGIPLVHPRTRFYASDQLISDFPGRVFEILGQGELRRKSASELFPDRQANVMARNVGLSSEELKNRLKLRDGGSLYAIGAMDVSGKRRLLKCIRVRENAAVYE
ncbi:MAG: hypothetical protein CMI15_14965 [Opitutaceae bacterium]|nr:hypothetical protein [Opitutaceae bacterium]